MNRKEESLLIKKIVAKKYFKDLTNISHSDKPDIVANFKDKLIGIEITECFQDDLGSGSELRKKRGFKNKIGNALIEKLNDLRPCFHLSLDIDITIPQNKFNKLIEQIELLLRNKIKAPKNNTPLEFSSFEFNTLGFNRISMFFTDDLDKSYFGESDYGGIPNFTNHNLDIIINKKEQLIPNYQPCDEFWLLIREGDMIAGSFSEIKLSDVSSIFKKIFMYRIFSDKLIEIK